MDKKEVVYCETLEEWQTVNSKLPDNIKLNDSYFIDYEFRYKDLWDRGGGGGGFVGVVV